jgi:hypothetical protein
MGEMTREDILRMAGEAGLLFGETEEERFYEYQYGWQQYAKFASLVAAAERDRFVRILGKLSTDDNLAKNSSFCPVCNRQEMVRAKFDEESG